MFFGALATAWSFVRSSKLVQYVILAGAVLLAIWLYGRSKKKQGQQELLQKSTEAVLRRMERSREIHKEISDLPLSERARRLRELDNSQ